MGIVLCFILMCVHKPLCCFALNSHSGHWSWSVKISMCFGNRMDSLVVDYRLIHFLHVSLIERRPIFDDGCRRDEFNVVFFLVVRAKLSERLAFEISSRTLVAKPDARIHLFRARRSRETNFDVQGLFFEW